MTDFKSRLEGGGALSFIREVLTRGEGEQKKWLYYTDFLESSSLWQIRVSDGEQVWSSSLRESDIEKLAGNEPEPSVISELRSGEVEVVPGASNLSLCLKSASQPLELQPSGPQSQQQIRSLVFELWSRLNAVQSQLADCQRKLEDSRHEKTNNRPQDLVAVDASRGSKPGSSRAKRPAGASLVNPNTKRRKAVKGVVFGDSQDEQ